LSKALRALSSRTLASDSFFRVESHTFSIEIMDKQKTQYFECTRMIDPLCS